MLAHHAMPDFRCRSTCKHKECQRHAYLGIVDQHDQCQCLGEVNASSIFLENVLDMANTLAQIMIICGIHECKAKSTVDVTTYAFLHYDQVCYCLDTTPKKRLRKEDLFHELGRKCLMNRVEAQLAYTIVKRGFKAFYYRQHEDNRNVDPQNVAAFSEECVYVHAAKKTAESYARYDGLSCEEQRGFEAKIKVAYKKFYDRMVTRRTQPAGEECNCCFCAKKRGHMIYGKEPPCSGKKKETPHKCPHCCKKKQKRFIHPSQATAKCPVCHRSKRFCTCAKYQFTLNWVKSIWERPDFSLYYKSQIEQPDQLEAQSFSPCSQLASSDKLSGSQLGSKINSKSGSTHGSRPMSAAPSHISASSHHSAPKSGAVSISGSTNRVEPIPEGNEGDGEAPAE